MAPHLSKYLKSIHLVSLSSKHLTGTKGLKKLMMMIQVSQTAHPLIRGGQKNPQGPNQHLTPVPMPSPKEGQSEAWA